MNNIPDHIRTNLYEFYDRISQICGLNSEIEELWSVSENIPGYWPRLIYRVDPEIATKPSSVHFSEKVKSGHLPELLIASDENIQQTDPFLRQQGFFPFSAWKGMAMTKIQNNFAPELPVDVEIVEPECLADQEQWLRIVNTELVAPLKMDKPLLESIISNPGIKSYLLKHNGVGVSTILTFETAESTGLYLIATEKPAQKQGFASLLVQNILVQNARRSKNPVILHATQSGERIYLKLGFQSFNQFFLYRQLKIKP